MFQGNYHNHLELKNCRLNLIFDEEDAEQFHKRVKNASDLREETEALLV